MLNENKIDRRANSTNRDQACALNGDGEATELYSLTVSEWLHARPRHDSSRSLPLTPAPHTQLDCGALAHSDRERETGQR